MKVYMIREKEYAEVNECYAARLFEQKKAIPAGTFDETDGKYWLGTLKTGMENAEKAEAKEAEGTAEAKAGDAETDAADAPTETKPKSKRTRK